MNDFDNEFYRILYDKDGNEVKVLKEQIEPKPVDKGEWREYNTSHGHCGLCGRITCNGQCFK